MVLRIGLAIKSFNGFQKLSEESDIQTQILTHKDLESSEFARTDLDLIIWQPEFSKGKFPDGLTRYFENNSKTGLAVYNVSKSKLRLPKNVKNRMIKEIINPPNKHNLKLLLYNTAIPTRSRFQSYAESVSDENDLPLVGESKTLKQINDFVNVISKSRKTHCLIRGEKGTEKEYIARLIHFKSNAASKPFHVINCKTVAAQDLLEQVFGVTKNGSGKLKEKEGYLDLVQNGTIVLNHIEAVGDEFQNRLVVYLDTGIYRRLNSKTDETSNARIIAITEFNLETYLQYQHFSRELFFRLRAFELVISPLRHRKADILSITNFYINFFNRKFDHQAKGFTPEAEKKIKEYQWPGNAEELRLLIERAVLITREGPISVKSLPFVEPEAKTNSLDLDALGDCSLQDIERAHIKRILSRTNGNKSRAAEILNISRTTLREKMRVFDLNPPQPLSN